MGNNVKNKGVRQQLIKERKLLIIEAKPWIWSETLDLDKRTILNF
jgi:hypothetical protein